MQLTRANLTKICWKNHFIGVDLMPIQLIKGSNRLVLLKIDEGQEANRIQG